MLAISLDIETYGIASWLPSQKETRRNGRFIPEKSLHLDLKGRRSNLVVTAAITIAENFELSLDGLCNMEPGPSMSFVVARPQHLFMLLEWWRAADVVVGQNLQFDIRYLRQFHAGFRRHEPLLVDLSVINYLDSENRPERSLKTLGPLLGTHDYEDSAQTKVFDDIEEIRRYNCEDTHNTLLAVKAIAQRIRNKPLPGDKCSARCLQFYSDTIWSTLLMCENGVPLHIPSLERLEHTLTARIEHALRVCRHYDLLLSGPGSQKSRHSFIDRLTTIIDQQPDREGDSILSHPLIQLTPKKKEVSLNQANLSLFTQALNPNHRLQRPLRAWLLHDKAQKLLSSYVYPLLHHRRNHPDDRTCILVPQPGVTPCTPAKKSSTSCTPTSS